MGYQIGETYDDFMRVQLRKARKFHAMGFPVYILSNNMRLGNIWQPEILIPADADFYKFVNEYSYYNCDNERGRYPNFFLKGE